MYLFGVNVIICIFLDMVLLLLKYKINTNRQIENSHELEMNAMLSDVSVNYKEGSIFSYNYGTKELTKKKIVHYTDYIKLAHEYSHAIHNEVTGYDRLWAFYGLIVFFLVLLTLVLLLTVFLMDKVIFILALSCLFLYFIYYLFVVYIEVSANTILLKKRNIKEDKLVVAYIILNMVNEFVFRLLGFVVLYIVISKA
ncbi:MAG: hypothetical protein NNC43_00065 [Candidatus Granulicatella sp. P6S_S16_bin.50.1]|nr:hypothetical protein [Candidatus Granulicatella sp. P6S_S16_bin.50.1]